MLKVHPGGFFSRSIRVTQNGHDLATIKDRALSEGSRIFIEGVEYELSRSGYMSGDYILSSRGVELARGSKPSFVSRRMTAEINGAVYDLRPASAMTSRFLVELHGVPIGSIGPRPMWNSYPVDLPAEMLTVYKVFLIALVALMWARGD